ncbi:MAG: 30S ribosomal protein S17 [Candidatus Thorarchaeota archaeon SMTZ-45]|nr:MAG: 30S ribosomal protein S17 [Candidatus Thorarchaeota archaeon SMTZ1-45]KXH76688.1 MAG: 30S ribosomal protein S17 [Candidatus Thorarchaeota archaeon SMTZ-45]
MAATKNKVRNIGIPNVEPPEKICDDRNCPFHGNLSVRGRVMEGTVTSTRMHKAIVFQTDYLSLIKKYARYERRRSKKLAHLPPCIEANVGDTVKVVECRPLSKNIASVVVAVTPAEEGAKEE